MATVSVVVPVYFNEPSLPVLFDALLEIEGGLKERNLGLELIFVDDGSRDGSMAVLRELKKRRPATKVVKLTRNFGAVHASKTGMRFVTGDCFLVLAADLQDPPELILQAVDLWRQGAKFVICVRQDRQDSTVSILFSKLYYLLIRLFVVRDYPQGGYDPALMSREFLPYMLDSAKNVNTPLFAYWLGFEPVRIYYSRRKRLHGKSRWTFLKRVKFFLDSILGFSIVPIRMMSLFGALVSLASFGYGAVIAVNALRGIGSVPGFPTLVVILSFLLGVVIMMLGTIGEYIWRIFDEVSRRPEAVVDEVL
ncbi:MAG TPA: glycosyltransferase family 2 protein [Thermoanaerobaculia bacterium]|nr:glycosyltransferase family 2 protein [Thermoanaerobaculia bacterium]